MGIKSCPDLTLSFLFMTALYIVAAEIETSIHVSDEEMTWEDGRLYCQNNHIDMLTKDTVEKHRLVEWMKKPGVRRVWIGLHRDRDNVSAWKWINLRTGVGLSEDSDSNNDSWAEGNSKRCAYVSGAQQQWSSLRCIKSKPFYCTLGRILVRHTDHRSWSNASQYCKKIFGDLSTVDRTNAHHFQKDGWIGLFQTNLTSWTWVNNIQLQYRNWAPGEPVRPDCAYFAKKKWYKDKCSINFQVACFNDNLVVVKENKTWEDALMYCRAMETTCVDSKGQCVYQYDLLNLQHKADYDYVRDRMYRLSTTDEVWVGLRFLGGYWWWTKGMKPDDQDVLPECPSQWKHCGTVSKHDTNNWTIRDCSETRNFICLREKIFTSPTK